jgi:methylated-DNA-[protein]-cysteine S-methyltransferase
LSTLVPSPIGPLGLAVSERGVVAVQVGVADLAGWRYSIRGAAHPGNSPDPALLTEAARQLAAFFDGALRDFDLPIDRSGWSAFQEEVAAQQLSIPFGETRSYGEVARLLGRPRAARAVGRVGAANPVAVIIPCHRVIGSDGSLRGYRSPEGTWTKAWLLAFESEMAGRGGR